MRRGDARKNGIGKSLKRRKPEVPIVALKKKERPLSSPIQDLVKNSTDGVSVQIEVAYWRGYRDGGTALAKDLAKTFKDTTKTLKKGKGGR